MSLGMVDYQHMSLYFTWQKYYTFKQQNLHGLSPGILYPGLQPPMLDTDSMNGSKDISQDAVGYNYE